jgi:hypothetical protein
VKTGIEVKAADEGCLGEAMNQRRTWRRGWARVEGEARKVQIGVQVDNPVQIHRNREGLSAQAPDSTVVKIEDRGSQSLLTKPRFHRRA